MNYYEQHNYVSNSELGNLHAAMYGGGIEIDPLSLQRVFDFGNLVDTAMLEPHLLDHKWKSIVNESTGEMISFNDHDWRKGLRMAKSAMDDPIVKMLLENAKFQYAYYRRNFPYVWDQYAVKLNTRCKFDALNMHLQCAADVKTTSSVNDDQFKNSIKQFHYYRQAALYMDLARIDRFWFIGISKKTNKFGKHDVFKFAIKRGDDMYTLGFNEYSKLGVMYDLLIKDFNFNLL